MIDFNNMVEKYLHRDFMPKTIGRYYPSEIGACMRKTWFSYTKPKETETDIIKIFHAGNILHDFVVDVLKSVKTDVELLATEFPFRINIKNFTVSGRIDNLILVKNNNKKVLVEVKSCSLLKFIEKPSRFHLSQLQFYMHNIGVHDGMLLYVEKNTLQSKSFFIAYDAREAEKIVYRFEILHKALVSNDMPDPEARIMKDMSWLCKKCPYLAECYQKTPADILP